MIKETVDKINALVALDVEKLSLVERVNKFSDPVRIYPARYTGSGEYEAINLDFYHGLIYHRLNGTQSSSEGESMTGCGTELTISQPIRMILYCSKGILGTDDDSSVYRIASNLRRDIVFSNDVALSSTLKVDYVNVTVNNVDFDSVKVWNDEFENVDYALASDKCLIAVDYTVEIKGDKDCILEYECNYCFDPSLYSEIGNPCSGIPAFPMSRVDDTNVTLTLNGDANNSLLKAVELELGWQGILATGRGGTGLATLGSAGQVLTVNGTATGLEYTTIASGGLKSGNATQISAGVYTSTITGLTSYTSGEAYVIKFDSVNDGSSTLNINSLGAKTIYKNTSVPLSSGDIKTGQEIVVVYDGTNFQAIGLIPTQILAYVHNAEGAIITKGQVVYAYQATGNKMSVKLAKANSDATSAKTIGFVYDSSIGIGGEGYIIIQGVIEGINTGSYSAGDTLYLSGTTYGGVTNVKPYAPTHLVYVGIVERANAGNGQIYVRCQNGYELDEIHNVDAFNPNNNDGIFYNTTTSLWEHKPISTVLGYTPADDSIVVKTSGSYSNPSWITSLAWTKISGAPSFILLSSLSATSPLSYDNTTGVFSIQNAAADGVTKGAATFTASDFNSSSGVISIDYTNAQKATAAQPGFLTSTDWTTFNSKVSTSRSISTSSPLSGGGDLSADRTLSIQDAAADGTTKGAATFSASDFDSAAGVISIDYTNGQAASASNKGFLTSADWTTFNNKQSAISLTTTGTSGASTFVSNTLNIPQYQGALTLTTTGTSGAATLVGNTLNIPQYSGVSYTFSTGLTNTSGTVTANLSTGVSGGQSVIGGTAASNNLTLSSTSNATKGKIVFGTSAYDEVNNRLGIQQSTPTSKLHLNHDENSPTPNDANGILLANATAATVGVQSVSPALVFQGNGWKTTATAASQDVRFRMYALPVQGTTNPSGQFFLQTSINGAAYSTAFSYATSTSQLNVTGSVTSSLTSSGQILGGVNSSTQLVYRTTNGGASITPAIATNISATAGTLAGAVDITNGIILIAGNGTRGIARAAINITNLTNTAGSESGDLQFLTQSGGTAISEKMRIFAAGNVAIGTTTNNGFKLDVNGTSQFQDNITISDAKNIILNATTGTKIGTATTQKLAFWNAAPIAQPTTAVASATRVGGGGTTVTDTDTFDGYTLAQVVKALRNAGLLA